MSNFFKLASTAVIHELLDKEVIIANLDSGIYYSLRGTAVPVWQFLLANYGSQQVIRLFAERYTSSVSEIESCLNSFMQKLVEENLLLEAVDADVQLAEIEINNLLWPAVFAAPILERYDEMTQLLMLDPIHEVDEQGWPHELVVE